MSTLSVVPGLEALPMPASPELLRMLHLIAALAFLIFMNLALAWPIMTLVAEALGHGRGDTSLRRLAVWLSRRTPGAITLAVTLAIPSLLLSQIRYGAAVLPAAQQMAWFWLAVSPLLFVGGGTAFWVAMRRRGAEPSTLRPFLPDIVERYILAFRRRGLERPGLIMTVMTVLSLLAVGFIICAHEVLVMNPALWGPEAGEPSGTLLPLRDPQLLPRLLHTLLWALMVAGFSVAWHGANRVADGEIAYGRTALRFGALWFAISTGLQALAGPWLLYSLPADLTKEFMGGSQSFATLFWSAAVAGIVAVVLVGVAVATRTPRPLLWAAAAAFLVALVGLVTSHQRIRELLLDLPLQLAASPAVSQPGMAALFTGVAALGAAVLGYMIWATSGSSRSVY